MREIDKVIDKSERILWEGKPKFWPFFLGRSVGATFFGGVWLLFLLFFFVTAAVSNPNALTILLLTPYFWIGILIAIGVPIYTFLVYNHTYYAITDKRIIMQKGIIGRDFEIIDFDQLSNAGVNVGLFDKLFGKNSGSILLTTPGTITYTNTFSQRGTMAQRPHVLSNIHDPYNVFKLFKKVSFDVKADIQYPNRYRPKENVGYQTEYKGGK